MPASAETNALFKAAFADPADELPRLVFADWLEDTGTSDNAAWARYIRLGTVTHCGPMLPAERAERRIVAARAVSAKLTLPYAEFIGHSAALFQLLPAPNLTVKLAGASIPLSVLSQIGESRARDQVLLPIEWSGRHAGRPSNWTERTLVVAVPDPLDLQDKLLRDEIPISAGQVHCVGANRAEILAAVDRGYSGLNEEWAVRALLLGFPVDSAIDDLGALGTLAVPPVVRLAHGILADALHRRVSLIRLAPRPGGVAVSMRGDGGWATWNFVPSWLSVELIARLREMAALPDTSRYRPPCEWGLLTFEHRGDRFELPVELTRTPDGPDLTITVTEPIRGERR